MKKKIFSLAAAMVLILCALTCVYAAGSGLPDWYPKSWKNFEFFSDPDAPRVVDNADILTDEEEARLSQRIAEMKEKTGRDLVIYTDNTSYGKSKTEIADDFYDALGYGSGPDREGMCLYVDMDPNDRGWWVSCTGPETMALYTEDIANQADDDLYDYLAGGNYYDGFLSWVGNMESLYLTGMLSAPEWFSEIAPDGYGENGYSLPRLYDPDEHLSSAQYDKLLNRLDSLSEKGGYDIVVIAGSSPYCSKYKYGETYFQYGNLGVGEDRRGLVLVTDKYSAELYINGPIPKLSSVNISRISDRLNNSKDTYKNITRFLDDIEHMQKTGRVPWSAIEWISTALAALLFGSGIGFIFLIAAKSTMKVPVAAADANQYVKPGSLVFRNKGDYYLYTHTSRVRIPKTAPSSGRSGGGGGRSSYSGGHSSSSGSSHSGSGRSF